MTTYNLWRSIVLPELDTDLIPPDLVPPLCMFLARVPFKSKFPIMNSILDRTHLLMGGTFNLVNVCLTIREDNRICLAAINHYDDVCQRRGASTYLRASVSE